MNKRDWALSELRRSKAGDVLVESGRCLVSHFIEFWTLGPSHVLVVAENSHGSKYAWEASFGGTDPCQLGCSNYQGVHPRYFEDVVNRNTRIWRLPLVKPLSNDESRLLWAACQNRHGQNYDYLGAALAGTRILKRLFWWRCADRSTEFCSEFVGSVLYCAQDARRGYPVENWGTLNPKGLVCRLQSSGHYGELQRLL